MHIHVIGAGITGLTVAYYLTKRGHRVDIFDYAREVGGIAGSFPVEGTYLEKYYHHIFTGHHEFVSLIKELGLGKALYFQNAKMGFYYENNVYPFATAKDLLNFAPLKIRDRVRLGLSSLKMMRIKDWRAMEKKSAIEWLQVNSGSEACRIIWGPLLKMKFGSEFDKISAAWLWNRVVDRKSKGNSGGKEVLGYIIGGYKIFFDALVEQVKLNGGVFHMERPVDEIIVNNGTSSGLRSGDERFSGDAVMATVSNPTFIKMTPQLPKDYISRISSVSYQNSICVILKLKISLSDYYWINISDPDSPFVGIIEHTKLATPDNYGNSNIVYLTKYTSSNDPMYSKSDDEIYTLFIARLKRIFPDVYDDDIKDYWVFRDKHSQPIFVRNYSKIMPSLVTPIKNLYLLNTSQLYPESRCLNSSIIKAKEAVKEILHDHGK